MNMELLVADTSGGTMYQPAVEEGVEWSTERRGAPGKLTFKALLDKSATFEEGAPVRMCVDGANVFFGFIFTKKLDKDGVVSVTAYDQLRYLKNKDTYVYEGITASQLLRMIAEDFSLNLGKIEDTSYVIPQRPEINTSLFEMIENALDLTLSNSKEMFVLYDDFGKLTLKNISNMYVRGEGGYLMIDAETGENFEYSSSIDSNTYNKIKLSYENEETKKRDIYIAQHGGNMNKWGILQYYDTLSEGENGQAKADALLSLYNHKTKNLRINNAFGDIRVRAGSMVAVNLDLGDTKVQNFMLVERATHSFKENEHRMDLTLRGGDFVA